MNQVTSSGISVVNRSSTGSIDNATTADAIVVGAGPVGLLMALKLGLAGISTIILEKQEEFLEAPRAIAYMPVVNSELKKMGLLGPISARAYQSFKGPCWRTPQGEPLALVDPIEKIEALQKLGIPVRPPSREADDENCLYMIGQDKLSSIVFDEIQSRCKDNVSIRFGQPCLGISQHNDGIEIMTTNRSLKAKDRTDILLQAKWLIGADGARSSVRTICCIPFEGFTWTNFRFTAADVEYSFDTEADYFPGNYIVDPVDWAVIARTGPHNVWGIAYGEQPELPEDEPSVLERSKDRIPRFLAGPSKNYKLRRLKPYWAQQRCASAFRKGRVLLVGDAAHTNNPVGGLGLTSGILDASVVGNALIRHLHGETEDLINRAVESRRSVWLNIVNPQSQKNYLSLCSTDKEISQERSAFFSKVNSDPSFALAVVGSQFDLLPDDLESDKI